MSNQFDQAYAGLGMVPDYGKASSQQKQQMAAAKAQADYYRKQTAMIGPGQAAAIKAAKAQAAKNKKKQSSSKDAWRSSYQTATGGSNKDAWRSSYQTASGASSQSTASGMTATRDPRKVFRASSVIPSQTSAQTATRAGAKQPLTQTRPGMFTTGKTGKGAAPAGGKDWQVSKAFGKGPLAKARGRRPSASGSPSLGGRLSEKYLPAMASMDSFQGMPISTSPQGFSYPEIPQQVAQEVPNYYAMSRQARGLPPLPPESGNNDHEIAQFLVEKVQVDADKRRTVEETIYTILSAAAQSAGQAKDAEQARVLMGYANRWAQAIQKAQQTPAPQQSAQQNDQGETAGFSLTEWVQDSSNTPWMLALALFGLAAGWHFYQKRPARLRVAR